MCVQDDIKIIFQGKIQSNDFIFTEKQTIVWFRNKTPENEYKETGVSLVWQTKATEHLR